MKIKKLILQGFKSFADRTEFDFREGITVIVGPNGCGKSNVVDAVKWVLGEQRPTSLRGKEMQDVIFSGTDQRRGVGFAEVSLVFDNGSQTLPLAYEEIAVTRRLYRSGESEYLINGNAVRLRDIRELLMDSGGGPGGLTVMEQGNIDRLLRADPQERRVVFEEAAGIAKYRARRREAERKLERTDENLARLRDILSEYETRQRSLKIQAGKARRFRELTDELRRKRVAGALARYRDLTGRRDEVLRELDAVGRLEGEARRLLEEAVDGGEEGRRRLDAAREEIARMEAEMAALVGEGRAAEERRAALEREAVEREERAVTAEREASEAARDAARRQEELERARDEVETSARESRLREEALEAAEALLAEAEGRVALLAAERASLNARRTEALAAESEAHNREVSEGAELKSLHGRLERLAAHARTAGEELASLQAACEQQAGQVRSAEALVASLEERQAEALSGAQAARHEAEERSLETTRRAGDLQALGARRDVLAGLVASGEGLGAGTRALLDAARAGEVAGIRGTVADLLGDAGEAAPTLDQALGELAAAVVVDTTEHALRAVAWLQAGHLGRVRLVPLDRVEERPLPAALAGFASPLAGLVGGLLAGTRIVGTVEEALAVDRGTRVIALSGEEFEAAGGLVGGTGDAGVGFVRRHAELAEVEDRLADAHTAHAVAQEMLAQARSRAAAFERAHADLQPELRQARDDLRTAVERLATTEKAVAGCTEELDLDRAESADIERQIAECAFRVDAARAAREEAARGREGLDQEADSLERRATRAVEDREDALGRRTEAKVQAARWAEKREAAEQRIAGLDAAIAASRAQARARGDEASACRTRRRACLDEIEVVDRLGRERETALHGLSRSVEEQRASARALQEELTEGDRHVRALRQAHEQRREELERHRMREQELRLRVDALLDQVRAEHGLDLADVEPDETAGTADPAALEAEIADLREKLERLGNVNHAALEELAQVEEKLAFMRREEADLVSAERHLRETIEKIDEISTARFVETFEKVRDNFNIVFRKLFGGGKAEVFLEQPEDPLNTGVEIRVRPPGKELRNLALLSGGEKSLTTVALLFSIYQTKPPPFCLLDEVDAALDESNTVRMCEMLKEFAARGQFLVITHARPTMTVADTLYGVTMPEAGVSRRVAVRFQDIEAGRIVGLN